MASTTNDDRLRQAFLFARSELIADGQDVTPSAIVFRALEEAMSTLRRLPDRERGWLYHSFRSSWPEVIGDRGDAVERYKEMLERLKAGEESFESIFRLGGQPSPADIARMEVILQELPKRIVGLKKARDWKIVSGRAAGRPARIIAEEAHCHRNTVRNQCEMQCGRIAAYYKRIFPEAFGSVTLNGNATQHQSAA